MILDNAPNHIIAAEIARLTSILLLRANSPTEGGRSLPPDVQCILQIVMDHFNISFREIATTRRTADLVDARHTFIALCRDLTHHNTPAIALFIREDMHHSTILHAHQRINALIETDKAFAAQYHNLKEHAQAKIDSLKMPLFDPDNQQ